MSQQELTKVFFYNEDQRILIAALMFRAPADKMKRLESKVLRIS